MRISNFKIIKFTNVKNVLIGFVILFLLLLTTHYSLLTTISAEPNCDSPGPGDLDFCISRIEQEIGALKPAHEYNKKELAGLKTQINSLTKRITAISAQVGVTEKNIGKREEDLAFANEIFNEKAKNHYKFIRLYDPLLPFLSSPNASSVFREIVFRQKAANADIKTMEGYAGDLLTLKKDKEELEKNKTSLTSLKIQVNSRADFLAKEVDKTEDYLETLSARQEELAALKAGGFQTSVGDTPETLEPCSGPPGSANFCDPGFRPAFAGFSFGAPHRTGMSQYGAYGRSKSGQSAETILSAYFQGAELNKGYSVPGNINVSGYGSIAFEDNYLLGIYEVPESWGDSGGFEALKAQAVAARSYALAVTSNGAGNICATESCQVYKPQLKSGKWREAVNATRGWVMTKGGSPAPAYYSASTGGYTISQWGWSGIKDTSGDWPSTAYEKIAGSPWFYKGWYKSRGGASCGKNGPWLKSEELADIVNAWHVIYKGGGDSGRVSPVDTSCWGGNPYSTGELSSIGGYTGVSSVSVVYANSGSTQTVN